MSRLSKYAIGAILAFGGGAILAIITILTKEWIYGLL